MLEKALHYTHAYGIRVHMHARTHIHTQFVPSGSFRLRMLWQWIHAIFGDGIAHPLADHHCNHDGNDVVEATCQLKHDHNQGDCKAERRERRQGGRRGRGGETKQATNPGRLGHQKMLPIICAHN